jgi:uncharacterized protein
MRFIATFAKKYLKLLFKEQTPMRYHPIVLLALFSTLAHSASFDCKKASAPVERLICSDQDLSALDNTMAELFTLEVESTEASTAMKKAQKTWLSARNTCRYVECAKLQYEARLQVLSCDPQGRFTGSAIGSSRCSYYSLRALDRELIGVEAGYSTRISAESNNPEYTKKTALAEQQLWRQYRAAQCALYGATEGGLDGWKNAFAGMCEVDETEKRIARLKAEQ